MGLASVKERGLPFSSIILNQPSTITQAEKSITEEKEIVSPPAAASEEQNAMPPQDVEF